MRPRAVNVESIDDYNLIVTFDNGEVKLYDVKPLIKGCLFGQLKDVDLFNTIHVAGLSVEWDGGQDVCPDDLYDSSIPYTVDGMQL